MGDCSQHKHMPSWLTHFLLHSTSQRWATQAQDTTASCVCVCVCMCVYLHACMYGMHTHALAVNMESRCLRGSFCYHHNPGRVCAATGTHTHTHTHTHRTSQLNVKEGIFLIRASREDRTRLIPLRFLTYVVSQALTLFISSHRQDILMRSAPSHSLWYICVRARVCERERACCIILLL